MKKLQKFTLISAVIMLIIAVLYAIQVFGKGLTFYVPIQAFGLDYAIAYLDLYNICSCIRLLIFMVFFAVLLHKSEPQTPIRKASLFGLIFVILLMGSLLQTRLSVLLTLLGIFGFGIASVVIGQCLRNKLFSIITIVYFAIDLTSFIVYRTLYLYHMDVLVSFFDTNWCYLFIVRHPILSACYLFAFSRIKQFTQLNSVQQ